MNKKKILFLYLKTGGGHFAPARSVSQYINKYKNAKADAVLIDGFAKSSVLIKIIIEDGYRILQSKAKWIYELIYAIHKIKIISIISAFLVSTFIEKKLEKTIANEKPDKIIIFHFFMIMPVYKILKKKKLNIHVITVVTDPFSPHPIWFLKKDQTFIVFSSELKQLCLKRGIENENVSVFPFVLDEKFSKIAAHEEISAFKKKLGFNDEKVLLILGGGDGIPKGIQILKSFFKTYKDYEIAIVCGKDPELYDKALQLKEKNNFQKLKVFGYIDFVYELISLSDIVITKCGASTFMEILISRKIPIVNSYIWEQEKGNLNFLVNNNLGIYEKRVHKLPEAVNDIFSNLEVKKQYHQKNESFKFESGTPKVADYILNYPQMI